MVRMNNQSVFVIVSFLFCSLSSISSGKEDGENVKDIALRRESAFYLKPVSSCGNPEALEALSLLRRVAAQEKSDAHDGNSANSSPNSLDTKTVKNSVAEMADSDSDSEFDSEFDFDNNPHFKEFMLSFFALMDKEKE